MVTPFDLEFTENKWIYNLILFFTLVLDKSTVLIVSDVKLLKFAVYYLANPVDWRSYK